MRTVVKKWGNSASVRIPSAIMEAAELARPSFRCSTHQPLFPAR
jgi:hypothetical protein